MRGATCLRVLALGAAFGLAGCATAPQSRALAAQSDTGLARAVELERTPFWPQQQYQCGPAALATVLGAQGLAVRPEQLVDSVYVPALKGSLPAELAATARRYGMLAYPLDPSLPALLTEVAAGHPVLVLQNLGLSWVPDWHFAVVIGYDLDQNEILLRSGTTRRWRTSLAAFERTWARGDYWALVVLPPGRMPVTARAFRYLQAVHDMEAGAPAAAASAYRAAQQRWPRNASVSLALGNNHYAAGDYRAAAAAFRQATELAPRDPRGWNNLAYALLQTSCPLEARSAAACAVRLAPHNSNFRDSLKEIEGAATHRESPDCEPIVCAAAN